jgi:hypothetical protein
MGYSIDFDADSGSTLEGGEKNPAKGITHGVAEILRKWLNNYF